MWKCTFILLFATHAYSQQITFSKTIDFKSGLESSISVIETDSGYALIGFGNNFPLIGGWRGCLFVKTDSYGDTTLSNFYGKETINHFFGWVGSFIKVSSYGYAFGVTEFDSTRNNAKATLIRYTEEGDTVFVKRYGGNSDDLANQVIETPDKGFALIGKTNSFGIAFYLVKTDSLGDFEWQKTYASSSDSRGLSIALAHDGGFILSGWSETSGFNKDPTVVKTDSAGNQQWIKKYGTKNEDGGAYINPSSDSSYIVWGMIDTFNLTTTTGQKLWSNFIMKIDLEGDIIWRYITNYNWYQQINMVRETALGKGYIVTGVTYDAVYGAYNDYGWLIRLDNDGNILWERKYAYPEIVGNNGLAFSYLRDVQPTSDEGFICLGNTFNVNADFWLLKLDSLGCMGNYCGLTDTDCYYLPYPDCDDTVGVIEVSGIGYQDLRLRVYPNPARDEVFFLPAERGAQIEKIILHDLNGRVVLTQTERQTIDISHLPQGVYYYEAYVNSYSLRKDNIPIRGKIIRQ